MAFGWTLLDMNFFEKEYILTVPYLISVPNTGGSYCLELYLAVSYAFLALQFVAYRLFVA